MVSQAVATTYNLTLSAYGATGTIQTDGDLGALTAANITGWNITMQDTRGDFFTLTGNNSYLAFPPDANTRPSPIDLTASLKGLYWNFNAADYEVFEINSNSDPPCECYFLLGTSALQTSIVLYDGNEFSLQYYSVPATDLIGVAVPTSVVGAGLPGMLTVLCGGLFAWWRRGRRNAAVLAG
jgi:hypothetical protein